MEFVADHVAGNHSCRFVGEHRPLIVLRSLTKSWRIPGLRGWDFWRRRMHAWMERLRTMQPPWSINAVAQAWAAECLTPRKSCATPRRASRIFKNKRPVRGRGLSRIAGLRVCPSAANFLARGAAGFVARRFADLPRIGASRTAQCAYAIRFHGMPKGRFIRLAVRTEEENNLLGRELTAICIALNRRAA